GIRSDCGIYTGFEVSPYYDPILAKLIAWGENREVARQRMIAALCDYPILGIKTPIEFLKDIIAHPEFAAGHTFTNFIDQHLAQWKEKRKEKRFATAALIAAALDAYRNASVKRPGFVSRQTVTNPWLTSGQWQIASTT
ncbi:MAG: acetyl-CoA carboxylase biotin carboxylase subunit, partial [candidate division KSB1 bacterium]|nr:acetyl-CoA carboxylase biotin carboxylase subunit [candidate division KSB1 bacterium]